MRTGSSSKLSVIAALAVVMLSAAPALGQVSLTLTAKDSGATSAVVQPGSSLNVIVSLLATSQNVSTVDYFLQVSANGGGKFRITDRSTKGSPFSFVLYPDKGDNSGSPGVEDPKFNTLVARAGKQGVRNALDLGATIANINSSLPARAKPYFLANYVLSVAKDIAPGTYQITTYSDPETGWAGPAPNFKESSFSKQGAFTVTVQ